VRWQAIPYLSLRSCSCCSGSLSYWLNWSLKHLTHTSPACFPSQISYTNPYPAFRTFTLRSNQPWLLQFTPPKLQVGQPATHHNLVGAILRPSMLHITITN